MACFLYNKYCRFMHDWKAPWLKFDSAQQNYLFTQHAHSVSSSPNAISV